MKLLKLLPIEISRQNISFILDSWVIKDGISKCKMALKWLRALAFKFSIHVLVLWIRVLNQGEIEKARHIDDQIMMNIRPGLEFLNCNRMRASFLKNQNKHLLSFVQRVDFHWKQFIKVILILHRCNIVQNVLKSILLLRFACFVWQSWLMVFMLGIFEEFNFSVNYSEIISYKYLENLFGNVLILLKDPCGATVLIERIKFATLNNWLSPSLDILENTIIILIVYANMVFWLWVPQSEISLPTFRLTEVFVFLQRWAFDVYLAGHVNQRGHGVLTSHKIFVRGDFWRVVVLHFLLKN